MDDVHEPCQQFHVFQEEVKVGKNQLWIPGEGRGGGGRGRWREGEGEGKGGGE